MNDMYCSGCGEPLDDNASFCHVCGRKAHNGPRVESATRLDWGSNETAFLAFRKSGGMAILLGLLIVGGGQMYIGKVSRGVAMLLFGVFGWIFLLLPLLILDIAAGGGGIIVILALIGVFMLAFVLWTLYDAHELVKEYNDNILRTGRPPW